MAPGDVLAVATSNRWPARLIRAGEALSGKPCIDNHVVVVHHRRADRTWIGVAANPSGVGWTRLEPYLGRRGTRINSGQPIPAPARKAIADGAAKLIGTAYDWDAIVVDGLADLGVPTGWADSWRGQPAALVCSSLAAWLYRKAGVPHPCLGRERYCQPSDWAAWVDSEGWVGK